MENITPVKPSLLFSYWRPWYNNTELVDSYLDYVKDVSLAKYSADSVGRYINEASQQQVNAIDNLGRKLGIEFSVISNHLVKVNGELKFLNKKMEIQIEQEKITNLLLENIGELLKVPDMEKERLYYIENGLKYFKNALNDEDLFSDALEELLKAEKLKKQDPFVLHKIGLIYLYAPKLINPQNALDYFSRAAKYSILETDGKTDENIKKVYENDSDFITILSPLYGYFFRKENPYSSAIVEIGSEIKSGTDLYFIAKSKTLEEIFDNESLAPFPYSIESEINGTIVKILVEDGAEIKKNQPLFLVEPFSSSKKEKIPLSLDYKELASDSYEKAAFSSYVLGNFQQAVSFQEKSLNVSNNTEKAFFLSKYHIRADNIELCLNTLNSVLENSSSYILNVFNDFDLINEPKVLSLLDEKNTEINSAIVELIKKWEIIKSDLAPQKVRELSESLNNAYEIKVNVYNRISDDLTIINEELGSLINKIRQLQFDFKNQKIFISLNNTEVDELIQLLDALLDLSYEKMQVEFLNIFTIFKNDIVNIGSKYAGGIVFFIDKTGKHGYVMAPAESTYDLQVIWGTCGTTLGTKTILGSGKLNTELILQHASSKGFLFSKAIRTAARICSELSIDGYTDWFLPSRDELSLLYKNLSKTKFAIHQFGYFWSSSEENEYQAFCCDPSLFGRIVSTNKFDNYHQFVRAIRSF